MLNFWPRSLSHFELDSVDGVRQRFFVFKSVNRWALFAVPLLICRSLFHTFVHVLCHFVMILTSFSYAFTFLLFYNFATQRSLQVVLGKCQSTQQSSISLCLLRKSFKLYGWQGSWFEALSRSLDLQWSVGSTSYMVVTDRRLLLPRSEFDEYVVADSL